MLDWFFQGDPGGGDDEDDEDVAQNFGFSSFDNK